MNYNQQDAKRFIREALTTKGIRYEVHDFESGASMIDIWYNDKFYVIQIQKKSIGLSMIDNENPGFDAIPDEIFFELNRFTKRFNELLS